MAFRLALTILAGIALMSAAPTASAQQVEGIAAVVNDQPITTLDVRDRMRLIISSAGVQPTEEMLARIQDQAIRGLVDETLQLQQAAEFDLEVEEAEVDDAIADIATRSGATVQEVEDDLAASGIDINTLRQQVKAEIAWQILVSGRYRSRIRISDQQIETALDRYIQSASQPQYRLGEIFVEITPQGGEERAVGIIQTIYDQLRQGAPFQAVAQQFSDAASASAGGDTGYLPLSGINAQVAEAVTQMEPGQISNPIRVPGGFQIVALIDRRDGQVIEQLTLSQITIPSSRVTDENRAALGRAAARINSCEGLDEAMSDVEGAFVTNLGDVGANALVPTIRDALGGLEPVAATPVLDTAAGAQVFVLCDKALTGPGVPSADQIENQLINQQLSLLSRRWLRDLRRDATIEIR
ncbi:MAG: peptidylprolyl isomerase [Oceanicaulis sp.]|jgi:peptidyl-prolyl cis-trans isomerase SurA|uniref:peptidylprolyl isomerase n=1 Tax=unclassified Oceanicaulis TaxID=2632123 RepID=UPI000C673FCF|nr:MULTISPECIES: peptidylprolyl isomerase [unclassified Oceanicaulis]MBC38308.1 peptidylprolyl isomerase [Oceanicaulis sp.]MBG36431.1 peptidylprolyl isomerase [Oceanicaulis sp.]HBU61392.1 peptidylprolyl isomerase [Oceanicaulis sp.]HCR93513.1 peptidylprolyl isomerase [Oceanicaulis sp.]|tara:strand:- start:1824 stop:3059 length:1236 start_codon:yes stop_codon:yes gene_type:complete